MRQTADVPVHVNKLTFMIWTLFIGGIIEKGIRRKVAEIERNILGLIYIPSLILQKHLLADNDWELMVGSFYW